MIRFTILAAALLVAAGADGHSGRESDEVARLRERVEALEARLEAANREIEALRADNQRLRASAARSAIRAPGAVAPPDEFVEGASFMGSRHFGGSDLSQEVTLVITKRSGTTFEGRLTIVHKQRDRTTTVKVTGSAPVGAGAVEFKSEKRGSFEQAFAGRYAEGELSFRFSGRSDTGSRVSGAGELRSR